MASALWLAVVLYRTAFLCVSVSLLLDYRIDRSRRQLIRVCRHVSHQAHPCEVPNFIMMLFRALPAVYRPLAKP